MAQTLSVCLYLFESAPTVLALLILNASVCPKSICSCDSHQLRSLDLPEYEVFD